MHNKPLSFMTTFYGESPLYVILWHTKNSYLPFELKKTTFKDFITPEGAHDVPQNISFKNDSTYGAFIF